MSEELFEATIPDISTNDEIICVVDRSGSMQSMQTEAENGLNKFIDEQKKLGKTNITIIEFDDKVETFCDRKDVAEVPKYALEPRGMTALFDAIGLATSKEQELSEDAKKIVVILTDGQENSSQEYTAEIISNRIADLKEKDWEFMFLGADQDAILSGGKLNIDPAMTIGFTGDNLGVADAYATATHYVASTRTSRNFAQTLSDYDSNQ